MDVDIVEPTSAAEAAHTLGVGHGRDIAQYLFGGTTYDSILLGCCVQHVLVGDVLL